MIDNTKSFLYWNYFIALEKDLDTISRYIEFNKENEKTYSVELAKLFLSTSSEIDVVLKEICKTLNPESNFGNINDYRALITETITIFADERVYIDRYGLEFQPWKKWKEKIDPDSKESPNPDWWKSYNNVKHQRSAFYNEANLLNTLNAISALLISTTYFYHIKYSLQNTENYNMKKLNSKLKPQPQLLTMNKNYYYSNLVLG